MLLQEVDGASCRPVGSAGDAHRGRGHGSSRRRGQLRPVFTLRRWCFVGCEEQLARDDLLEPVTGALAGRTPRSGIGRNSLLP